MRPTFVKSFTDNFIGWKLDSNKQNDKKNTGLEEVTRIRQEMIIQANTFKECLKVFCSN